MPETFTHDEAPRALSLCGKCKHWNPEADIHKPWYPICLKGFHPELRFTVRDGWGYMRRCNDFEEKA